jgi:hypothetical protein
MGAPCAADRLLRAVAGSWLARSGLAAPGPAVCVAGRRVGVEIYGVCIPCLGLAACSLYDGLRMVRRNSRAHAPIKKSVVPVVLGVVIIGAVIGMFVTGFLGPTIGVGPGG